MATKDKLVSLEVLKATTQADVNDLKSAVVDLDNDLAFFIPYGDFERKDFSSATATWSDSTTRIAIPEVLHTTYKVGLKIASGYNMILFYFNADGTYLGSTGWLTGSVTVDADRYFAVEIANAERTKTITLDEKYALHESTIKYVIADIESDVSGNETAIQSNYETIMDAIDGCSNIANPSDKVDGSVWLSATSTYSQSGWSRITVSVQPGKTYTTKGHTSVFSFFANENGDNFGNISTDTFTTPAGCTLLKISKQGTDNFVVLDAAYDGTMTYAEFPYGEVKSGVAATVNDLVNDAINEYCGVSIFEKIAVVGDSYESGGIYNVTGIPNDMYYDLSWPTVMQRRNGITINNYSQAGASTRTWLTITSVGLPKALADDPSCLYLLCLGINDFNIANYLGTIDDITDDYTENPDTFYGNYARIFEQLSAHASHGKFIFVVPPFITNDYKNAIINIANHYSVPYIISKDDAFFSSDFYNNARSYDHPVAVTYSGMALAYERLISRCIVGHVSYFMDYYNPET